MTKFIEVIGGHNIQGSPVIMELGKNNEIFASHSVLNMFMCGGADSIAKLIAGNPEYKIATMYLEFENGSPSSIIEPSYAGEDGIEYFNTLESPKDYLRIPITVNPLVTSAGGYYESNQASFFGITSGIIGVNGLTYSESAGSVIYGGALVVSPDPGNAAKDVLFARTYWVDRLFPKHDGRQIGVQWAVKITSPGATSSSSSSSSSYSSSSDSSSSFSSSSSSYSSSSFSSSSSSYSSSSSSFSSSSSSDSSSSSSSSSNSSSSSSSSSA